MTTFRASSELEQYLRGINPNYAKYTQSLWANEVHSTSQLGNASVASILACGVQSAIHAEDIIAQSKPTRNPRGQLELQHLLGTPLPPLNASESMKTRRCPALPPCHPATVEA